VTNDPIFVLEQQQKRAPQDQAIAASLAALYLERARSEREQRYFGRAEVLLQPWLARGDVSGATLRVQADILQNRHDFAGSLRLLDRAIEREPRDAGARLMRASVMMVQGRAGDARADCAAVLSSGASAAGTVCFAQILGATGKLAQAQTLLQTLFPRDFSRVSQDSAPPAPIRGWALWLMADFADRRGDAPAAEHALRAALAATPTNEGVRSALVDLLLARGASREALSLVDLPAPSVGLLARRARAQAILRDPGLSATRARIDDLLNLATRRGERPHLREEALLALDLEHDPSRALELAKANFAIQRETIDVRLLVRAARVSGDTVALIQVAQWLRKTGFEDRMLEGLHT
jgi:tetratricopeptide (TPR) repeat protein